jgi:4,5-dihydroxyphthalate decarboxylase
MAKIQLTLALNNSDRHHPLFSGEVEPEGIDLCAFPMMVEEMFWRQAQFQEFDACEFAGAGYILLTARQESPFIAIPVFPLRAFRHSSVYISAMSGIERPEDLKGKRMGAPEYEVTAVVWARDMLEKEYGVKASDTEWFTGGLRNPGRKPRVKYNLPPDIKINPPEQEKTLEGMLESGEIDALISPRVPEAMLRGRSSVRRLFPRYWEVEADYFRRTRINPIMHTVVIKKKIAEKHPWIPFNLYRAFVQAKNLAVERYLDGSIYGATLPFLNAHVDTTREIMGEDFWPYGAEANRHVYGYLAEVLYHQHLATRAVPYEELFPMVFFHEPKV